MGIDISSVELLHRDLGAAPNHVVEMAKIAIRKTAVLIRDNAKVIAPVDTGNLRNSITHSDLRTLSRDHLVAEVGPTANYGRYVEHGTSRMAPQAFMGPSMDRHSPGFEQAMAQLGAEALRG